MKEYKNEEERIATFFESIPDLKVIWDSI